MLILWNWPLLVVDNRWKFWLYLLFLFLDHKFRHAAFVAWLGPHLSLRIFECVFHKSPQSILDSYLLLFYFRIAPRFLLIYNAFNLMKFTFFPLFFQASLINSFVYFVILMFFFMLILRGKFMLANRYLFRSDDFYVEIRFKFCLRIFQNLLQSRTTWCLGWAVLFSEIHSGRQRVPGIMPNKVLLGRLHGWFCFDVVQQGALLHHEILFHFRSGLLLVFGRHRSFWDRFWLNRLNIDICCLGP